MCSEIQTDHKIGRVLKSTPIFRWTQPCKIGKLIHKVDETKLNENYRSIHVNHPLDMWDRTDDWDLLLAIGRRD